MEVIFILIIAFLVSSLCVAVLDRNWNLDEMIRAFIFVIVNVAIDVVGYFVNAVSLINIFRINNIFLIDGGLLVGSIAFIMMTLICITVNRKLYHRWNPDGSYKSMKFWFPIGTYILFDVLLPLHELF